MEFYSVLEEVRLLESVKLLLEFLGFSFLCFNLLCAPCFAAIGAIKREMNDRKWTWFAILYQTLFAYFVAFVINQFGLLFTGSPNYIFLLIAILASAYFLYSLFKKDRRVKA